ncbi:hypothetical protein POTOM_045553 [Populus tomentosa]|uniref:LysM domain-containing protein n=1 Tax=Populus tomentosa TaxID=118781 RepID=A0A8X7YI04_POPTO|nr:hypothetical protein POTOM_045553 [Populus tomentosa]
MEVKLSHRRFSDLSLPRFHFPNPKTTFPSPRGETLTSISKQYGVSIYSVAAANKNKLDVDLVFEGQLLNIPASAPADTQVVKKCESPSFDQLERLQNFMKIMDGVLNQKPFITVTTLRLPHAKATGYFLVLVPALAFCIRCIIGAFHTRARRNLGCQASNESRRHHDVPESKRWKHALSDLREPDNLDGEPILNSTAANILLLYNDVLLSYQMRYCTSLITNCEMETAGVNTEEFVIVVLLQIKIKIHLKKSLMHTTNLNMNIRSFYQNVELATRDTGGEVLPTKITTVLFILLGTKIYHTISCSSAMIESFVQFCKFRTTHPLYSSVSLAPPSEDSFSFLESNLEPLRLIDD